NQQTVLSHPSGFNPYVRVAFRPDGKTLASTWEKSINIWKLNSQGWTRLPYLKGHKANILALAYSPDGLLLASADGSVKINLWNAENGALLRTLTGHKRAVMAVTFSPDGRFLISGSLDKTVRIWELPFQALTKVSSTPLLQQNSPKILSKILLILIPLISF